MDGSGGLGRAMSSCSVPQGLAVTLAFVPANVDGWPPRLLWSIDENPAAAGNLRLLTRQDLIAHSCALPLCWHSALSVLRSLLSGAPEVGHNRHKAPFRGLYIVPLNFLQSNAHHRFRHCGKRLERHGW